jgi:hypothetical protein
MVLADLDYTAIFILSWTYSDVKFLVCNLRLQKMEIKTGQQFRLNPQLKGLQSQHTANSRNILFLRLLENLGSRQHLQNKDSETTISTKAATNWGK